MALAIGAVALIVIHRGDARMRLNTALRAAGRRPFHARLTGLEYAPPPRITRSAAGTTDPALRLRAIAGDIAASTFNDDSIRAIAALFANDVAGARERLKAVAAQDPDNASAWNDVAASLSIDANGNASLLCSALAAADRAIAIEPDHKPARFNRAVILESLSLRDAAQGAYADYLRVDGTSGWAIEARDRLRVLRSQTSATSEWNEQKEELARVAIAGNQERVAEIVSAYPQEARTWAEAEFLGNWGARAAMDVTAASSTLSLARMIGAALRAHNGESLLADAVAAIDDAAHSNDRARLSALALAHSAYRDGRKLYGDRQVQRGREKLFEAQHGFASADSPMRFVAAYYLANANVDAGQRGAAVVALKELSEHVPLQYRALLAQMAWLRGTIAGMDGLFELALNSYERATVAFQQLGEQQNAIETRARSTVLLAMLGRTDEAWEQRGELFRLASATGSGWRLERVLFSAALDSIREERWDVAAALLQLVTQIESGSPRVHAEGLVWRPLVASRAGLTRIVQSALAAARSASTRMKDAGLRDEVTNELRLVEALLVGDADPARSIDLLGTHIAVAERTERTATLPQVYVERARLFRKTGRFELAENDLRTAIAAVEHTNAAMEREELRDSFMGKSSTAYDALAEVLDAQRDWRGAVAASDRRRARAILDGINATTPVAIQWDRVASLLPKRTALLTYGTFADRTVVYIISARGIARAAVSIGSSELKKLARKHARAIADGDAEEAHASGRELNRILVEPVRDVADAAETLVFIAEKPIDGLSFATLVRPDGRFLIESHAVAVAPSVQWYVGAVSRAQPGVGSSVLSVGGPTLDTLRFPDLLPLRGAEREARDIAALYPKHSVLVGDEATKAQFIAGLHDCDVVHIAAHALVDPTDSRNSRFLFAGPADASVTTRELADMSLGGVRVAVLAGCQTAVSANGYGDVRSLASGLLAAGVRSVVASLWDVDDEITRDLSITVHRELRKGSTPADALRIAQLQKLRDPDARLQDPRVWAALQLYGCGR
jgi:CHAT domain-containing protein